MQITQATQASNDHAARDDGAITGRLDTWSTLVLSGPEAIAFAQAQWANDVNALAEGQWHWNSYLSAQGRVLALFPVARPEAQRLLAFVPASEAEALAARLKRYVFRTKVQLHVDDTLTLTGQLRDHAPEPLAAGGALRLTEGGFGLHLGGAQARTLWVSDKNIVNAAANLDTDWRRADIVDGIPRIVGAVVETQLVHALGLERLQAFSVRKGCYPGQEIVARTHFLGRNKRLLARWQGATPLAPITRLLRAPTGDAESVGEVIDAVADNGQAIGLAVLREDAPTTIHAHVDDRFEHLTWTRVAT